MRKTIEVQYDYACTDQIMDGMEDTDWDLHDSISSAGLNLIMSWQLAYQENQVCLIQQDRTFYRDWSEKTRVTS